MTVSLSRKLRDFAHGSLSMWLDFPTEAASFTHGTRFVSGFGTLECVCKQMLQDAAKLMQILQDNPAHSDSA